ncbi:hypothetical protein [Neobacillus soli]|uniref:hypothetical protein n=1 Tax=Neobacillus soli TaxID=220688 RepID=UPI0008245776|nr:hypothetical protein [Neobacillus soli]
MMWTEVRENYPNKIVLAEALKTSSHNKIRSIEEMSILSVFQNSMDAWEEYKKVHKERPDKELYILHTSREKAEVVVEE